MACPVWMVIVSNPSIFADHQKSYSVQKFHSIQKNCSPFFIAIIRPESPKSPKSPKSSKSIRSPKWCREACSTSKHEEKRWWKKLSKTRPLPSPQKKHHAWWLCHAKNGENSSLGAFKCHPLPLAVMPMIVNPLATMSPVKIQVGHVKMTISMINLLFPD